jgi:sulfotransferase family protein
MTLIDVSEVALDEPPEGLLAHGLDTPAPGAENAYYGLDVRGWVVGRQSPAAAVTIRHAGGDLGEVDVGDERPDVAEQHPEPAWSKASGFFLPVGALRLDREFELAVHVRLEDSSIMRLGRIRGRRSALQTAQESPIQPIGLTALGRTGSTAVTRLLAAHPKIAAYRPFEYEPRVATYWIDLLQELAGPSSFRRQITPNGPLEDHWWVGARPPYPRRIVDEQVQAWLGGESIEDLAAFCKSRIDGLYAHTARLFDRAGAGYFVEKLGPRTGALLRELYQGAREIFLVRDFRDMVASVFAFNEKRGYEGFGRSRSESDAEYVTDIVAESVASFAHAWSTRSAGAHLLRYEDLVEKPRDTLESVLEFLGLEAAPATVDGMLESLGAPELDVHRTTAAQDSIGRWRSDLSPQVREACAAALGPALHQFGYEA